MKLLGYKIDYSVNEDNIKFLLIPYYERIKNEKDIWQCQAATHCQICSKEIYSQFIDVDICENCADRINTVVFSRKDILGTIFNKNQINYLKIKNILKIKDCNI